MAGLYIHVPFCKQACHYCDFHFSTSTRGREEMVAAICREIRLQKEYLAGETLESVYFGGGTPSLLEVADLARIFEVVHAHFRVADGAEITLEANPDDLSPAKLTGLAATPVNRLSIGIQSFHDPHLRFLNRAHSALEATDCIHLAQDVGLTNLSIDLIYAIPHPDHAVWEDDLQKAIGLGVPHVSAYCLTIEPGTVFGNWLRKGKLPAPDEHFAAEQFEMLVQGLGAHGYEQYEISNFAQPGWYARHNTNYWKNRKYLGVGPSAHSFNGVGRQFNVAHNAQYLKAIGEGRVPGTPETLTPAESANEYIMTSLRTQWGCDTAYVRQQFGFDLLQRNRRYLGNCQQQNLLTIRDGVITLAAKGKLLADRIAAELFIC
ncbi:MAG: radical SAM family heme chaperone HemW [Cytophagales bacterium]|nr:radical SAM family heme chaperone HemW [Cytophagales bacterium]